MIEVRLFATFRDGRPKISFFDPGKFHIVSEIADHFHISHSEVAICLVNGKHSKLNTPVKDNDVVALFPPIGGG